MSDKDEKTKYDIQKEKATNMIMKAITSTLPSFASDTAKATVESIVCDCYTSKRKHRCAKCRKLKCNDCCKELNPCREYIRGRWVCFDCCNSEIRKCQKCHNSGNLGFDGSKFIPFAHDKTEGIYLCFVNGCENWICSYCNPDEYYCKRCHREMVEYDWTMS